MTKDGVADKLIGEVRCFEDGSEDAFDQVWLATGGNLTLGLSHLQVAHEAAADQDVRRAAIAPGGPLMGPSLPTP